MFNRLCQLTLSWTLHFPETLGEKRLPRVRLAESKGWRKGIATGLEGHLLDQNLPKRILEASSHLNILNRFSIP